MTAEQDRRPLRSAGMDRLPSARSLAEFSGIKLRIFETPPAAPVFVSVRAETADLNEAVELANAAAFGFADLRLNYAAGSMELRYPIHE